MQVHPSNLSSRGGWLVAASLAAAVVATAQTVPALSPNATVIATGFYNPRGLKFGPDRDLYVAEAGSGGTQSTVGQCEQVPAPVGPYSGGYSARISKVDCHGRRTTVVDGLPSGTSSLPSGDTLGVGDVVFFHGALYAVLAGGGCSHGNPDVPNGLIRVHRDGTWSMVANLSAFQQANPVAYPDPDDFEPDGTWYSLIVARDAFYAVEPNHGEIDQITHDGRISRIIDMSALPWIGPTAIAFDGNFYVGNLTPFPIVPGAAEIFEISPKGQIVSATPGFTAVQGLAFDRRHRLYVLEGTTVAGFLDSPGTGAVVRITHSGKVETVATGLSFPSAMTFGPDGNLYVSNQGYGFPPALGPMGEIVRIDIAGHDDDGKGDY